MPGSSLGGRLYLDASCRRFGLSSATKVESDPNGYAAVVYLYAADLTLEQAAPPTASNVSGELASAPTVSGTSDVAFSASDPGSGVYEAVFSVDGKVVQSTVLNEDGGRCKNVGGTSDGLAAFLYVQPCPASVSADVGFDTAAVANGQHHLVVSVIDAAGNAATVLDRNVTVENPLPPGGPNGTNASAQAALSVRWTATPGERLGSGYGHAETILGRLTGPDGIPIVAAQVTVFSRAEYAGAQTAAMTGVRTDSNGRFTLRLPSDSASRTLSFEYSARFGSPPVVTKTLTLSVRAGVSLQHRAAHRARRQQHPLLRAPARRADPEGRQAGRARGALAGRPVARVQRDPQRCARPLSRELSLQVRRARPISVPRAVRSGGGLSVRDGCVAHGDRARALRPGASAWA